MKTVQILEKEDIVEGTDWCRPLQLCTMNGGHSDYMSYRSQYSGRPENNVKWAPVNKIFGAGWLGCSVESINNHLQKYEFVRGDIPKSHILTEDDY